MVDVGSEVRFETPGYKLHDSEHFRRGEFISASERSGLDIAITLRDAETDEVVTRVADGMDLAATLGTLRGGDLDEDLPDEPTEGLKLVRVLADTFPLYYLPKDD